LRDLVPAVAAALEAGTSRIVLDNTYVSRKSRAEVIRAASERGVPARCTWLSTSVDEAQVNAAVAPRRPIRPLPDDAELRVLRKQDPGAFSPRACCSAISASSSRRIRPEGFCRIDAVPFARQIDPSWVNSRRHRVVRRGAAAKPLGSAHAGRSDDVAVVEHRAAVAGALSP
jgi:hypothetical protein